MSFVIWRLHRAHALVATAGLAVLAAVLVVTGLNMANTYDAATATCAASHSCDQLPSLLFQGDGLIIDVVSGTMILPGLLGVLWGAPLVAGELEGGTQDLIWTQSITRRRWIATNMAWAIAVAILWGLVLTLLVSWWRIPENGLFDRLSPGAFDIQGIVPVAYSVCAMAIGIAAGVVLRRVMPAVTTALATFIGLRVVVALVLREHFLAPVTSKSPIDVSPFRGSIAHAWWLHGYITSPSGQSSQTGIAIPPACQTMVLNRFQSCLAAHGYHRIVTYQPADRFWTFQAIEAGIFAVVAVALLAIAFRRITTAEA
jgi:ABC-type transport system involved in multi-copper enzyme maturation permease subunit